jgi:DNA-binding transcriptional LysR family regulator
LPPNHPPARQPDEVRLTTLAAFPDGCTYRNALERWLVSPGASTPRTWNVMEMASYYSILACVAAGSCIALCPKSILDLQCAPGNLRTQQIGTIETYLVARSGYRSGPYDALRQSVLAGRQVHLSACEART